MADDVGRVAVGEQALVNDAPTGHRPSGFDPSRGTLFSLRQAVMDAIDNPEGQLPRIQTDDALEHERHWQARAVIKALHSKGWRAPSAFQGPSWGLML